MLQSKCLQTLLLITYLTGQGFSLPVSLSCWVVPTKLIHYKCNLLQRQLSSPKSILISPDTIRYYASFIHSTATINDLTIQFSGTGGVGDEELLRIPLTTAGELTPQPLIRITVGTNPPARDNDPKVGITDGVNSNQFYLIEDATSSTTIVNPCDVVNGLQTGRSGPVGNPVAGGYTLLFDPAHQFGSCMTNNGFATNGRFNRQVDASKGLSLVIHRQGAIEPYVFHYFLIEFL
jgi:hypothetical protein